MKYFKSWSVLISSLLPVFLLLTPITANSDVLPIISYSGQLNNAAGTAPATGPVKLVFNIYNSVDVNGDPDAPSLWTETHNSVTLIDGLYTVYLGSVNQTLGSLGFDEVYWLGITVDTDNEMTPLLVLTSVPTAMTAEKTDGSAVPVDCSSVATGGKIQAALDAGATDIFINGVCEEAVSITRNGVSLFPQGVGTHGIEGPNDGLPALQVVGASNVQVQGLTISEVSGSADESCVELLAGANVTFSAVTVNNFYEIGIGVILNSSANFTAATITGGAYGLEVVAGSNIAAENLSVSGFSDTGIFISEASSAYLGDEDASGNVVFVSSSLANTEGIVVEGSSNAGINKTAVTMSGTGTNPALRINGNSSVLIGGSIISSTNGWGVYLSGNSSLEAPSFEPANTISGGDVGIFAFMGAVDVGAGSVTSSAGSAVEIHNNSTAYITSGATLTGGDYGVACFSSAVLNADENLNITGTSGITNNGSAFCIVPVAAP